MNKTNDEILIVDLFFKGLDVVPSPVTAFDEFGSDLMEFEPFCQQAIDCVMDEMKRDEEVLEKSKTVIVYHSRKRDRCCAPSRSDMC